MNRTELQAALASVVKTLGQNNGRSAFAELITETINPNRLTLDVFSAFLPTRQLQVGDSLVKKTRTYGMPIRTFVPGTEHLADQLAPPREVLTYALDTIIAKVRHSLWELERGELVTVDSLRAEMQSALVDELVSRIFNLMSSIWNATDTPSNYVTVSSAITEAVLENMMEEVLLQAGTIRAITGTRKALLPIYKFAGLYESVKMLGSPSVDANPNTIAIPSILEEWRRTGILTTFRGVPLIELPQVFKRTYDGFDTKLMKDDQILVIGDNAGEAILYGGVNTQDHTDTRVEPPDYSLAMWRSFGLIIDYPERVGFIKIT